MSPHRWERRNVAGYLRIQSRTDANSSDLHIDFSSWLHFQRRSARYVTTFFVNIRDEYISTQAQKSIFGIFLLSEGNGKTIQSKASLEKHDKWLTQPPPIAAWPSHYIVWQLNWTMDFAVSALGTSKPNGWWPCVSFFFSLFINVRSTTVVPLHGRTTDVWRIYILHVRSFENNKILKGWWRANIWQRTK